MNKSKHLVKKLLNTQQNKQSVALKRKLSTSDTVLSQLIHKEEQNAFILPLEKGRAVIRYRKIDDNLLELYHTRVPVKFQGQGIGHRIAKEVFDFCLEKHIKISVTCSFLQKFKEENSGYESIIVEDTSNISKAHYFWKQQLYNTMSSVSETGKSSNGELAIMYGLGLTLGNRITEAIAHLSSLTDPLTFGATSALIYCHNEYTTVDQDALDSLEKKVKDLRKRSNSSDLYYAALTTYLLGDNDKAMELIEKHLKKDNDSSMGLSLQGWLLLAQSKIRSANKSFSEAIRKDKDNIDAVFGQSRSVEPSLGSSSVTSVIVHFPRAVTPLLIKMELKLAEKDWDAAFESANRALKLQEDSIPALEILAIKSVIDGNKDSVKALIDLNDALEKYEGKNAWWSCIKIVRACARCCSRNEEILKTLRRILPFDSNSEEVLLELAYLAYLSGDLVESSKLYRDILSKSPTATDALIGLTMVQLNQLPKHQIRQQVEFLGEINSADVDGIIPWLLAITSDNSSNLLDKAVAAQQKSASRYPFGIEYLAALNPDLLLTIADSYSVNEIKKKSTVLSLVYSTCPGLIDAGLALAKSQIECNELLAASQTLKKVMEMSDQNNPYAHLLTTQLFIEQQEIGKAESSLELGLSYNLKIQEIPQYHLLLASIWHYKGNFERSISCLKQSLQINKDSEDKLSSRELSNAYESLAEDLLALNRLDEALNIISETEHKVDEATLEDGRIAVVKAKYYAITGDTQTALQILNGIRKEQIFYNKAQMEKADIYLKYMKDSEAYADCFKRLVAIDPSTENLIKLGDAYLNIQESELAVQSYEKAMANTLNDPKLAIRLARLLVKCHQYAKAIRCYRESGEEGICELAELLLKLGQIEKAEAALSPLSLKLKAPILAKIQEKSNDIDGALGTLRAAHAQYAKLDQEFAVKICLQMASLSSKAKDHSAAIDAYKKVLSISDPRDSAILVALAKLYMQVGDWPACESICSTILNSEPDNETALLMLADLAYRKTDFNAAIIHFAALLERRPDYWIALARIIEVLRRTSRLSEIPNYLNKAKEIAPGNTALSYCKGLYEWYIGNMKNALISFNSACCDNEWGQQAIHNMIEISLNGSGTGAVELLSQLRPDSQDDQTHVELLSCFVKLHSGDKQEQEKAMIDLTHLANNQTHRIGASLGLAVGYIAQKQPTRAKNVLKRVAKAQWGVEEAEYLEKCWLLLAELYIGSGKNDLSNELLRKVLSFNQSSSKAYELLGLIAEKEQKYVEAGEYYGKAWKLTNGNDPALGYKLGWNLVKARRWADAIATVQKVLKNNPDYPRIRKDILEKAMTHLRT